LRSPILAALLYGTRAAAISQTLWHGTRNRITELSQRAPPIFGWAAIMLSISPHSSFTFFEFCISKFIKMGSLWTQLLTTECGPMPNLMVALQNIGGALCSVPQSLPRGHCSTASPGKGQTLCKVWLAFIERRCCSNEAKMRKPSKLAGMPQTNETISATSRPKFTILCGLVEEILLLKIFPIDDTCLNCEDIAQQSCAMVPRWRFFGSCISSDARAPYFRPAF